MLFLAKKYVGLRNITIPTYTQYQQYDDIDVDSVSRQREYLEELLSWEYECCVMRIFVFRLSFIHSYGLRLTRGINRLLISVSQEDRTLEALSNERIVVLFCTA